MTATKKGKEIPLSDAITGTLTNEGGNIRFKDKGEYILKCSFTDDGGRTYSYEQAAKVYPIPTVTYTAKAHSYRYQGSHQYHRHRLGRTWLEWLVNNSFGYQDWDTFVTGNLNNEGGNIYFKRAGIYELVARTTDETGREYSSLSLRTKTEVLPVLTLGFELPEVAYTDTQIDIRTSGHNNTMPMEWSLTKNGKSIAISSATDGGA